MEQFPAGWAKRLVEVIASRPNAVMVSPQLKSPNGGPGPMMGDCQVRKEGITAARQKKLPTACVVIRKNELRFDVNFLGSGWEDDDYCLQLRQKYPQAEFLVCHDVWIVHRNEMKNQGGENWKKNKAFLEMKWFRKEDKHL
jgi:hypothetical protein